MPIQHDNWRDMLAHIEAGQEEHSNVSNFRFLNTYFMESMLVPSRRKELGEEWRSIPRHLHIVRNVVRSQQVWQYVVQINAGLEIAPAHYWLNVNVRLAVFPEPLQQQVHDADEPGQDALLSQPHALPQRQLHP